MHRSSTTSIGNKAPSRCGTLTGPLHHNEDWLLSLRGSWAAHAKLVFLSAKHCLPRWSQAMSNFIMLPYRLHTHRSLSTSLSFLHYPHRRWGRQCLLHTTSANECPQTGTTPRERSSLLAAAATLPRCSFPGLREPQRAACPLLTPLSLAGHALGGARSSRFHARGAEPYISQPVAAECFATRLPDIPHPPSPPTCCQSPVCADAPFLLRCAMFQRKSALPSRPAFRLRQTGTSSGDFLLASSRFLAGARFARFGDAVLVAGERTPAGVSLGLRPMARPLA